MAPNQRRVADITHLPTMACLDPAIVLGTTSAALRSVAHS